MSIKETNGSIIIGHTVPVTLLPVGEDTTLGIEKFAFSDSTLSEEHILYKRDYGRNVNGGTASRKGKITIVQEKVMTDNTRRSFTQSVNLIAHSDFAAADVQQAIEDLGQFLLDNSADLSNGLFDS